MEYIRNTIGLGTSGSAPEGILIEARNNFQKVAQVFPKDNPNFNSSLPWMLGGEFCASAVELMKYPAHKEEARENIRDYVHQIVRIYLIQKYVPPTTFPHHI
jgi:hypothetical protein